MTRVVVFCLRLTALALVLHTGTTSTSYANCNNYLCLNNHQLYESLTGGHTIGKCRIDVQPGPGFCYLYVKAAEKGADNDSGYPKNNVNGRLVGTGCVKAPDLPKNIGVCFFSDPRYGLPSSTVASFCTEKGKDNAVAMIRHAIVHKKCGPCL